MTRITKWPSASAHRWGGLPSIIMVAVNIVPFYKPAKLRISLQPAESLVKKSLKLWVLVNFCLFSLHWPLHAAEGKADLVSSDYAEERVVDLSIVKKVTGKKKI